MGNKLKITIGKNSGFCFGVKRAYDLACACPVRNRSKLYSNSKLFFKKNNKKKASISDGVNSLDCDKLYILGKMVHNNDVCEDLYKRGVKEIKALSDIKKGTVIFTAHGVGPSLYEKASQRGLKIVDTTCPKVMKAQRLARNHAEKNWQVIIFGDKKHKEVKGIKEWSKNKAKIVGSLEEIKKIKLDKKKKYCLISQTTQNVAEFKKIKDYLTRELESACRQAGRNKKQIGANFIYFNTICESTDNRQAEIRRLAKNNDAVLVIGGKDSANSKRLYEIAKAINRNSCFIENEKQLKKTWFSGAKKIAISAGASTPEWVIGKVVDKIKKIA